MPEKRPDRLLGPGYDEFWTWCSKRELRLQKCSRCRRLSWPVVRVCEFCNSAPLDWERMSGRGTIVSWCSFEHDYYAGLLPRPWSTVLVELEEGVLFLSNPLGFKDEDITPGMPVEVDFLACEDSAGPFQLPVFRKSNCVNITQRMV